MNADLVNVTIGIDPGLGGGVAILLGEQAVVYDIPKIRLKGKKNAKDRTVFDMPKMIGMLRPFEKQNVLFAIEKVSVRPGERGVASFNFGEGFGYWKMAAVALGFKLVEIRPQEWKNHFSDLLTSKEILDLRDSEKALKGQLKAVKDTKLKKSINKEIATVSRQIKTLAKDSARLYATKLHPVLADSFKLKKDDGKAEALLIATYAQAKLASQG